MGKELLNYEIDVEKQCLNALTNVVDVDIPNVHKARKQLNKATTDMDTYRVKYQTALKLLQQNVSGVSSASKAESLKKELEDSQIRVDQSRVLITIHNQFSIKVYLNNHFLGFICWRNVYIIE
jgi:hypothetical protein